MTESISRPSLLQGDRDCDGLLGSFENGLAGIALVAGLDSRNPIILRLSCPCSESNSKFEDTIYLDILEEK